MRRLVGPLCAILLMVMAVGLFLSNRDHETSDKSGAPARPSSRGSPSTSADSGSSLPAKDRSLLNDRVKVFSALYFSLSPARSAGMIKQQVQGYATESFLKDARFGFGTSEADLAMKREGATLKVKAISDLVGPLMDDRTILGTVTLQVVKYDRDGNIVTSFKREQEMKWVKPGNVWLILEAPRT